MTANEQALEWCHYLASRGVTISQDEMREIFEKGLQWKVEDPRMLREQIRVADVAFNALHKECADLRAQIAAATQRILELEAMVAMQEEELTSTHGERLSEFINRHLGRFAADVHCDYEVIEQVEARLEAALKLTTDNSIQHMRSKA